MSMLRRGVGVGALKKKEQTEVSGPRGKEELGEEASRVLEHALFSDARSDMGRKKVARMQLGSNPFAFSFLFPPPSLPLSSLSKLSKPSEPS
jgi:hypothetical protein